MSDSYIYVLVALIPLSACMLVFQGNPYHALLLRGVLGAIAALVYAILGAGDVALTEALVGTLLAITLYAVTVRSSQVLRLGTIEDELKAEESDRDFGKLMADLRTICGKRHLRLELVPFASTQALHQALMDKEIHATCIKQEQLELATQEPEEDEGDRKPYQTATRVRRIYDIMQTELSSPTTILTYVNTPETEEKH